MRQLVGAAPHRQSRGGGVAFGVSVLTQHASRLTISYQLMHDLDLLAACLAARSAVVFLTRLSSSVPAALNLCIPATVRIQYSADIH
eukprot:COSAG01_NODE_44475_length_418_cov_17.094044_2_plen_86_part_01